MRSEEIGKLLASLGKASIGDDESVSSILEKIRNNAMKTRDGHQRLIELGCIPCVLKLLHHYVTWDKSETEAERAASEEKVNTALSVLANLLAHEEARQQVTRREMETIVRLLTNCTSEEVKLRCSRSFSNLVKEPTAVPVVAEAGAIPALLKLLEIQSVEAEEPEDLDASADETGEETVDIIEPGFPSFDSVDAVCRVLRYSIGDSKVHEKLFQEGTVERLAMLMKSQHSKLVAVVLRTLSELWTRSEPGKTMNTRLKEKMVSEFSLANIIPKVVELMRSTDNTVCQQASDVLLSLTSFVAASEKVDLDLSQRKELIKGLCFLVTDASCRCRLRDSGGLKIFTETLQDDVVEDLWDQVINHLICFLGDKSSLTFMVKYGLVNILLTHLQSCGKFTSDFATSMFRSAEGLFKTAAETSTEKSSIERGDVPDHPDSFRQNVYGEVSESSATQSSQRSPRFFKLHEFDAEPAGKRPKLRHEPVWASETQNNILRLLYQLSVHDDLIKNLATSQVVLCLTDHLALAEKPSNQCERILSRLMKSRSHCLIPLLTMCAPAVLVRTLMLDSDQKLIPSEMIGPAAAGDGSLLPVKEDNAGTGSDLLKSLSSQAESSFGKGEISMIFKRMSADRQGMCAASLLFLHRPWERATRQEFLIQHGALEKVLSSLCCPRTVGPTYSAVKDILGLALVCLSRGLHLALTYQSSDIPLLLSQVLQSLRPDLETLGEGQGCRYSVQEKDLRIVVKNGSASDVLPARREMLMKHSLVFEAMLQGPQSFRESGQSEVILRDACPEAVRTVLHFLHCCNDRCPSVRSLESCDDWVRIGRRGAGCGDMTEPPGLIFHSHDGNANMEGQRLEHMLNTIAVADQYLLSELVSYLCAVLSTSLLDHSCAEQVFQFASFHGLLKLQEECLRVLLSSSSSVAETTDSLTALAEGRFTSEFQRTLLTLLKKGVDCTP